MSEWRTIRLEDGLECLIDYRGKSPPKSKVGIPVISAKVIKDGRVVSPIEQMIDASYYPIWMTRGLPCVGDVVMTTEGPLGEVAQLDSETAKFALAQRIICMRGRKGILDNTFLKFFLMSPIQQQLLASYSTGTTVAGISQKALRSIPVRIPNYHAQAAVGSLLGALDDKIELNRRMNETLAAMARAIFKDWFIDFGPTRAKMEGHAPYLAPDIWSLFPYLLDEDNKPATWQDEPLSHFFSIIGGGTPKTSVVEYWGGNIPWFSVVDTPEPGGVFVNETKKTITEEGLTESSARLVPEGTTIISARGTVGNLAMAGRPMTFNQSCYGLRAHSGVGDAFVYLAAQNLVGRLQSVAHGSVFSTITKDTLEAVTLAAPPRELLAVFDETVRSLFQRIKANVIESRTLAQTRDLLLPKLMSGEIRIREAEKAVEAAA